jgi:hypothetical protein
MKPSESKAALSQYFLLPSFRSAIEADTQIFKEGRTR